ncbi:fibronectin type III domain-containing protein 7-like [Brachionichthys hirsutus]|uniref:fibronectin type III domain-containing protein 7-like n=1 Tax=Brachionichthys hirsutus TaxID=412623 RepID=UPI0036046962
MGFLKWLGVIFLLNICSQALVSSAFQASVFSATSRSIILRWVRVQGATLYKITVAQFDSPSYPIAFAYFGENTVMGSISSLSPNVRYQFTLEALDDTDAVLNSVSLDAITAPQMMDPIHTVKSIDSKTLIVEFAGRAGATHYIIRIRNANGFYRQDSVQSSPAAITNLEPYTDYTLSIMAANTGGHSQPSPPVTAKTILPPPQFYDTSSPSNDSITVALVPVAQAVGYSVSIYKLGSSTNLGYNTSNTNLTISGLDAGSLYTMVAFAWDVEGRGGERSPYTNQTTRPPTPSSVSASVASGNMAGLSVSWELNLDVDGSIQYHVMTNQNLTCNSTSNSCVLWGISCGEIHTIYVTAINEAGPSYPSSPLVFVTYPCPPGSLAFQAPPGANCTLTWDSVPLADFYRAVIKSGEGSEETCNTTGNNCTFHCECGFTYLMSVFAFNQAGSSPQGNVLNYTSVPCCPEDLTISAVSTDTLEITWTPSRGAVVYEIEAQDLLACIHSVQCKDTAPVCALSDLSCDTPYTVVVAPCNDISGCNRECTFQTKDTAPCMPVDLMLHTENSSAVGVSWTAHNRDANYTVSAVGHDVHTCTTSGYRCDIADLPCGSTYDVSVMAVSAAGQSLPSYSDSLETGPCCPANLTVDQVTQAMTNLSWSYAKGAHSVITSLTSPYGHARCHTKDSHCLMGCITCGTNYTVTMEAYSHSGQMSNCTYKRFSSSACCPSGVRIYRLAGNSLRVYWHNAGGKHSYVTEMVSSSNNYTCTASPGENSCDVAGVQCEALYSVVVAPLTLEGPKVLFCPQRQYKVTCSGGNVGAVIYRGKRSVD